MELDVKTQLLKTTGDELKSLTKELENLNEIIKSKMAAMPTYWESTTASKNCSSVILRFCENCEGTVRKLNIIGDEIIDYAADFSKLDSDLNSLF